MPPKEYTANCMRLLEQCKAAFKLVEGSEFASVEIFARKYKVGVYNEKKGIFYFSILNINILSILLF